MQFPPQEMLGIVILEHVGGLLVNVHHLADGQRCVITQHVPHGDVDDVRRLNELLHLVVHFRPRGGGGADFLRVLLEVLAQLLDFLGVGDVLVRADDHAVLLVDEAVHFRPYLLDGGFHLLAVDVDGYCGCLTLP